MENALPIILGLIFFAYKQYTKRAAENANSKSQTSPNYSSEEVSNDEPQNLDDYISKFMSSNEDYSDSKDDFLDQNQEADNISENIKDDSVEQQHNEYKSVGMIGGNSTNHRNEQLTQFRTNIDNEDEDVEFTDFDLNQAVLYDAILNPPYINN